MTATVPSGAGGGPAATGACDAPLDRRALGRALSKAANAGVSEVLAELSTAPSGRARRIGITGAPGAGKSTLIAALARHRLARGGRLAIIAIDPSSPATRGAVLGDRIRMDALLDEPRVYIRSFASRGAGDGLTHNLPEILAVVDAFGFDEAVVETVGVGQSEVAIRDIVDVEVLVMTPGAGDQIQAMKAGILETADIHVVNKADLPGAGQLEAELHAILSLTAGRGTVPPVLPVRADDAAGLAALSGAIDCALAAADRDALARRQFRQRLRGLVARRLDEVLATLPRAMSDGRIAEAYRHVAEEILMSSRG